MQFPFERYHKHVDHPSFDKKIYHKNLFDFFPRYSSTHFKNTLLVDNTLYRTYQNPPFNAIFIESQEDVLEKDNYLMKILLLYL